MEIKKCQEKDSKAVYNLIGELEEGTLDFSKFELAFKSKINNKKNYYIVAIEDNEIIGFLSLVIDY